MLRPWRLAFLVAGFSLVGGCATQSARFESGVIGDAPYVLEEEARAAAASAEMRRADPAFVVHVGDMQADPRVPYRGGVPTCTDESLARRMELFGASRHPFVLTPVTTTGPTASSSRTATPIRSSASRQRAAEDKRQPAARAQCRASGR